MANQLIFSDSRLAGFSTRFELSIFALKYLPKQNVTENKKTLSV
jgi:hypothetical protein